MAPRFLPAIASQSIGRAPHHTIETKLALIAAAGFHAIEVFFEDLEFLASRMRNISYPPPTPLSDTSLLTAAQHIHKLCLHHKLHIICLQPFANYEGLLSRTAHAQRIQELHLWIRLAHTLHTDLIQIPSSYLPATQTTSSLPQIITDLRTAADLGAQQTPPIRFAHEALAWATHADRWDQVYTLVELVDRPNFGTCIDTFNLLGRSYADPSSPDGLVPDAAQQLQCTLTNLRARLDPKKIFYVEAVDAERLEEPLVEGHAFYDVQQKARMSWSRNARLFPCEDGGYLPVLEVLRVMEEVGYEGYVAFEFFSRTAWEEGVEVPGEHVRRAARSWHRLCAELGWEDGLVEREGFWEKEGMRADVVGAVDAERVGVVDLDMQGAERRQAGLQGLHSSLGDRLGGRLSTVLQAH